MKSKTIVFTEAYKAELIETKEREMREDDVVVKMVVSSISSGTERANFVGDPNVSIYDDSKIVNFPKTVGYSSAGIVEKIGKNVTDLKIGDRVAMSGSKHTQYMVLHKNSVHKIESDNISMNEAALWYIACFPAAAIRKCHLEFGESAIVMGMGILGLIAVKLLSAAGAAPIVAVDPDPSKRELALKIGADYAFDPFDENFADEVKKVTNGGVNVAIEVTGSGKALDQVLDCMKKFGRVALLGCTRNKDFTIDYYRKVHGPGISLIGAHTCARPMNESFSGLWCTRDEMKGIQMLSKYGRLNLSELVEEIHSPEEAQEVFMRLATEKTFPVAQFDWSVLSEEN
ncbi:MAG: zinc-binding alcohol dehydrogenase [Clostridia bacterium]|nr:zinc-binding alcohol dehydrogenase [Clostridia bacterium]